MIALSNCFRDTDAVEDLHLAMGHFTVDHIIMDIIMVVHIMDLLFQEFVHLDHVERFHLALGMVRNTLADEIFLPDIYQTEAKIEEEKSTTCDCAKEGNETMY